MAKTVNSKGFWIAWSAVLLFLILLCAMSLLTVFVVGGLLHNPVGGYLTAGLITYMTNPRYWVMEYTRGGLQRRDIWVVFLWPIKLLYYVILMFIAAIYRWLNK